MGGPASHPSKPDPSPCLRVTFFQAVNRRKRVMVDLKAFRLGVDSEVLVIVLLFDLRTHDPLENLLPALGEFRWFVGHETETVDEQGHGACLTPTGERLSRNASEPDAPSALGGTPGAA